MLNPSLSIGDDILATTAASIVGLIIAGGTIGSLIALLLTGHLIVPIALVYGAALLGEGVRQNKGKIEDTIAKQLDIPSWIRPVWLGDKAIENLCEKMRPDLENSLREQLTQRREAFDELSAQVGQELKLALESKVMEAIVLIQ